LVRFFDANRLSYNPKIRAASCNGLKRQKEKRSMAILLDRLGQGDERLHCG
jgi:hypothetical protein